MKSTILLKSFIGFSLFYLLIILIGQSEVAWYMKPFLIPFLILSVYYFPPFSSKKFLLTALLFSWIGDVILLFADRGELYFIVGLVSFLISHLVYIFLFTKQPKVEREQNKPLFWMGILLINAYLFTMLMVLFPTLGELKIPVLVYALVISTMLLYAFKGSFVWNSPARWYLLLGAIVFVASDSILAFDKFYEKMELSALLIMSTYLVAQFSIVKGILTLNKTK